MHKIQVSYSKTEIKVRFRLFENTNIYEPIQVSYLKTQIKVSFRIFENLNIYEQNTSKPF